jgi:hypothetical protein
MPIGFTNRSPRQSSDQRLPQPTIVYALLIFLGLAGGVMAIRKLSAVGTLFRTNDYIS